LFFLLALYAYRWYARRPRAGRYAVVALLFALGLLAKPQVITLPFVLLLWDYWPLQRMFAPAQRSSATAPEAVIPPRTFSALLAEKLPLFVLCALDGWVTMAAQNLQNREYPLLLRLETAIVSYPQYVLKAFWPSPLVPMYPHPLSLLPAWQVLLASLFLLGVTALVIALRRHRYLPVGWFWFLGTLVPMIGVVQVGAQALADRYAYLPFVGLFIMICWGASELFSRRAVALRIASVAVLAVLAAITYRQIGYWTDNMKIWSRTLAVTRDNFMAENVMAHLLMERGKKLEGMQHYWAAATIFPHDPISNMQIAAFQLDMGQWNEAIARYNMLLADTKDPLQMAEIDANQAVAYGFLDDYPRARQKLEAAVKLNPNHDRAWMYLGVVEQNSGDLGAAVQDYSRAVEIKPSDVGYLLLARALQQAGRQEEAAAAMYHARLLSPNWPQTQRWADQLLALRPR